MAPYQERVIEEEKQLAERFDKLSTFLWGPGLRIDAFEQGRLRRQLVAMRQYRDVLRERIEAFTKDAQ
jgi:hypothetical protein